MVGAQLCWSSMMDVFIRSNYRGMDWTLAWCRPEPTLRDSVVLVLWLRLRPCQRRTGDCQGPQSSEWTALRGAPALVRQLTSRQCSHQKSRLSPGVSVSVKPLLSSRAVQASRKTTSLPGDYCPHEAIRPCPNTSAHHGHNAAQYNGSKLSLIGTGPGPETGATEPEPRSNIIQPIMGALQKKVSCCLRWL